MNVATRILQTGIRIKSPALPRNIQWNAGIIILMLAILFSAFGIVYLKDLNRRLYIQYQTQDQLRSQYEIEWGKLLLEQTTWSTQARIQQVAQDKLHMAMPSPQQIVLVNKD